MTQTFSKNFWSLFTVEKFYILTYQLLFFWHKKWKVISRDYELWGGQIWFKNWFSNAPIFFSCGPIFTSTVSKIFSLDRRIHLRTSYHPQTCQSYPKQTQQSWKKWKFHQIPGLGRQLTYCPRAFVILFLKTTWF